MMATEQEVSVRLIARFGYGYLKGLMLADGKETRCVRLSYLMASTPETVSILLAWESSCGCLNDGTVEFCEAG